MNNLKKEEVVYLIVSYWKLGKISTNEMSKLIDNLISVDYGNKIMKNKN